MPLYKDPFQEQSYEEHVRVDLAHWRRRLLKPPGLLERTTKVLQTKVNEKVIPKKVHTVITATVKGLVKSVVYGLDFILYKSVINWRILCLRNIERLPLRKVQELVQAVSPSL